MKMMDRLTLALLAAAGTAGCGWVALMSVDDDVLDAYSTNIRLCGFPASQMVENPSGGGRTGHVRLGQRLPLELRGELDRIQSVSWEVSPSVARNPPQVSLTSTARFKATLVGVAVGGSHPSDVVFASANLVFRDGSENVVSPSACEGGGWEPAWRIVVVP